MTIADKAINFKVDEELYKQIKVHVAKEGITLKDYVLRLIQKDLEEDAQNNEPE